jgi:zinc protease
MMWHSPRGFAPGDAELDMLAAVLAAGKQSRLQRALMHERQLAVEVHARQESRQMGSLFTVDIAAREGVDLDRLERTARREIEKLVEGGPSARELARARNGFLSEFMIRLQQLSRRAELLNLYWAGVGRPDYVEQDLARYAVLTREDLRGWARRVLSRAPAVMRVLPGEPDSEG